MKWISKRFTSFCNRLLTKSQHKQEKVFHLLFETPKAMEGFSCTVYHDVTHNSICIYIYWPCYFLQCVGQNPSKSSTTIKTFFFMSIWLIIVLILFSLGMCGTHFAMSVAVLHTYGKEGIGDDICHVAPRWKFCPKIVPSVSCGVFFHCSSHFCFKKKQTSKSMLKNTIAKRLICCIMFKYQHKTLAEQKLRWY